LQNLFEQELITPPIREKRQTTIVEWLTVERMLFGLLILVGAGLRFFALAAQPLSTMEAATAWASWLVANGLNGPNTAAGLLAATNPATSPLLYSLNAILFWLGGGNDTLARFLPALFGTGMIVLAWHLRPHLGRWTALALALLFTIDPWLVSYSRLADGAILSGFFGLLTLIGLLNWTDAADQENDLEQTSVASNARIRWIMLSAVGAGLLIVSGVQAWSFLPMLLLGFWLCADGTAPFRSTADDLTASDSPNESTDESTRSADGIPATLFWGLLAGAALLGTTGWLAFPDGLSYLSTSLSAWLAQISGSSAAGDDMSYPVRWLGLRLLVDQPLLLIIGVIGLFSIWLNRGANAARMPQRWPLFLSLWLLWGVVLILLPGRMPTTLLIFELPLLFAAAHVGGSLFSAFGQADRLPSKADTIVFLSLLSALVIAAWIMITILVHDSTFQMGQARLLLIVLVALVVSVVLFMVKGSRQQAMWTLSLFLFALLSLVAVSNSVQLNHRFDIRAPDAFFAEQTDPDIRALTENIEVLSSQRIGDPNQATVVVELDGGPDPLLGWYLRDMQNLRWGSASTFTPAQNGGTKPFLLSYDRGSITDDADESTEPSGPDSYLGSEYGLRLQWLPTQLPQYVAPEYVAPVEDEEAEDGVAETFITRTNARWGAELRPLLRWMFYSEVDGIAPSQQMILWVPIVEN